MPGAGGNHPLAFADGDRHRLLAQHVDAGLGGADRVLGVLRVGQGDVDGVDLLEAGVVVVVAEVGHAVAAGDLAPLGPVAADDGGELRVPGVGESREHGHLGDVAEPDHGITDGSARGHPGLQ
jgi:hypothetical protein